MHVHVYTPSGEAKFWLAPKIELAINTGLKSAELKIAENKIRENEHQIKESWEKHFG